MTAAQPNLCLCVFFQLSTRFTSTVALAVCLACLLELDFPTASESEDEGQIADLVEQFLHSFQETICDLCLNLSVVDLKCVA